MADNDDVVHMPKFTIRRLGPAQTPTSPPPTSPGPEQADAAQPPKPRASKPAAKPTPPPMTSAQEGPSEQLSAGLFSSPRAALAFLGAAFSLDSQHDQACVRRTPQGAWWAEIPAPPQKLTELIWAAGGRPYTCRKGQWKLDAPVRRRQTGPTPTPDAWPILGLGNLLAQVRLPEQRYIPVAQVHVVLPGRLAPLALRRATALGLRASMSSISLVPLARPQEAPSGAVLIELRAAAGQTVSRSLVHALGAMPYCTVCTPFQFHEPAGRLLIDVRCRLPLPVPLAQAMVPKDEVWVLAPPDVGHWQFSAPGEMTDCASLLQVPDGIVPTTMPAPQAPARMPSPIPVSLVPQAHRNRRVDAVLLDDDELAWLRRYLMTRPLGEEGYLLPGPGRHFISSPGGLAEVLPLGVPLAWVGPHCLFLETGTDFEPRLPKRAREERFNLGPESTVVVLREKAYRFDPQQAVPLWTLWVGETPAVEQSISETGRRLIGQVADALQESYRQRQTQVKLPFGIGKLFTHAPDVSRILRQAEKAERRGEFARAAELYEKAGQHGPAGRLYERAARALEE